MKIDLPASWEHVLAGEIEQPYFKKLARFVEDERKAHQVFPAEEDVFALEFQGTRYDCGTKLGYLQANLQFALKHPEIGADFGKYLRGLGRRTPK